MKTAKALLDKGGSMKYFLLDFAILLTFFVALSQKLRDDESSSAPECHPAYANANVNRTCSTEEVAQYYQGIPEISDVAAHEDINVAPPSSQPIVSSSEDSQLNTLLSPDSPSKDDMKNFQIGDLVELYGDTSYFAVPSIIRGLKDKESLIRYDLQNAITNNRVNGVAPEFVHPYEVYEEGTEAYCNVGALRKLYMTPCTIISHLRKESGFISYRVSYSDNEVAPHYPEYLPFSRVQRNMRVKNK